MIAAAALLAGAALLSPAEARAQPDPVSSTQPFAGMSAAYRSRLKEKTQPDDLRRGGDSLAALQLQREGEGLTEAGAAELERRLARHPNDVASRVRLLGFYGKDPFQAGGRARRKPHVLRLIRTMPESALLNAPVAQPDRAWSAEARRAWEPVLYASTVSAEALGTAAGSLAPYYDDEAVLWLSRAAALQPLRALWRDKLGELFERKPGRSKRWAARALAEYDAAQALGEGAMGDRRPDMIRLAQQIGRVERAVKDARALLADLSGVPEFQRASAVYEAEQALARQGLRAGDLDAAGRHMIASCAGAEGSNVYLVRPEPSVALELERRGRRGALADFERACSRFPSWETRVDAASVETAHEEALAFDLDLVEGEVTRTTDLRAPYLARFERGGRVLWYVAARHENTRDNATMGLIRRVFEDEKPEFLIIEGVANDMGTSPPGFLEFARKACGDPSCPAGEPAYAALLAAEKKIPFAGGEPSDAEVASALEKLGYGPRDQFGFYFVRRIPHYRREGRLEAEKLPGLFEELRRGSPLAIEDFPFEAFKKWYLEKNGKPFDLEGFDDDEAAPKSGGPYFTQRISAAINVVRNRFAVRLVERALSERRRVVIVYGGSHFLMERRALEAALGAAVIRKFGAK